MARLWALESHNAIRELLAEIERIGAPARRIQRGRLSLAPLSCTVEPPTAVECFEVEASLSLRVPPDLQVFWSLCGGCLLFVEPDDKLFTGSILFDPQRAIEITRMELDPNRLRGYRASEYRAGDLVFGECRGDDDRLVMRCDPDAADFGAVVISLPLDDRPDWYVVGDSLASFLRKFIDAQGAKFWERGIDAPFHL